MTRHISDASDTRAARERIVSAGVQAVTALAEAIRGLKQVPSGVLYAHLMSKCDIHQYEALLAILERAGLITVSASSLITWIGPGCREVSV